MRPDWSFLSSTHDRSRRHLSSLSLVASAVVFLLTAGASRAQDGATMGGAAGAQPTLTLQSAASTDALHIKVGRSIVLHSDSSLRRVYVGNPAVLQTYTSGGNEVVLTAKSAGISSLVVWDEQDKERLYSVSCDIDPESLADSLKQAFPGSSIHAQAAEGKIFLTGSALSDAISEAAAKMASLYAKDVVNSLQITPAHGRQVELKLRIVEVDRTRLEQMGVNIFAGGRTTVGTTTEQFTTTATQSGSTLTVSNPLNLFLYNQKLNVGLTVQDLEQKQILQVLAEPTLTTLSGLPARFLSGGEFPFPVVEGTTGGATAISIQFRPYGVKVDFTPTVNDDGTIRLKLAPEVSTLDYTNAVTVSGFTIPALSTRRAETEVEIQNGQSFMVSGLLDHRTTEIMSKIPGISSVPVLGQLFRSKNFNHSVEELVIIVTATVVDPLTTKTEPVDSPKFVVPNLEPGTFDAPAQAEAGSRGANAEKSAPKEPR